MALTGHGAGLPLEVESMFRETDGFFARCSSGSGGREPSRLGFLLELLDQPLYLFASLLSGRNAARRGERHRRKRDSAWRVGARCRCRRGDLRGSPCQGFEDSLERGGAASWVFLEHREEKRDGRGRHPGSDAMRVQIAAEGACANTSETVSPWTRSSAVKRK